MKAVAIFLLFFGMILVLQGYYSKETTKKCKKSTTQIKYVPRSVYEEQIAAGSENAVTKQFKGMFEDEPWYPARG
jgi:hypothetical protein